MVELTAPRVDDVICDPASGTCGFLVAAGEYLREQNSGLMYSPEHSGHFHHRADWPRSTRGCPLWTARCFVQTVPSAVRLSLVVLPRA
ncbi:MAG: hypothetical protein ACRDQU_01000, partial [Pseudonocardiaceae bacterium]